MVSSRRIIVRALRSHIGTIALLVALIVVGTGLHVAQPLLYRSLIDEAIPGKQTRLILQLLAGMALIPILSAVIASYDHYLRLRVGLATSEELRRRAFRTISHGDLLTVETHRTGELVERLTLDAGKVGEVFVGAQLLPLLAKAISFIGVSAAMLALNWRLTLVLFVAYPIAHGIGRRLGSKAGKLDTEAGRVREQGSSYLIEFISGLRTIRACNGHRSEADRWDRWLEDFRRIKSRSGVFHDVARLLVPEFINQVGLVIVFGYGVFEILGDRMTLGTLVAFTAYVPRNYATLRTLLTTHIDAQGAKVSANKLDRIYGIPLERGGAKKLLTSRPGIRVEFDRVAFDFDREGFGVRDLSFTVEPGEFVGIVGPSGVGKSTVIDLILGFHTPHAGAIRLDGEDIVDLDLGSLRDQVGHVSQDVFLWNASIYDNVVYPRDDISLERVRDLVRAAQAHDLVAGLPEGLQTTVGERGHMLSGGERQRLAIVRSLLREPRLLLLDESSSALDALTELQVRRALADVRNGRTMIAVTHLIVSIMHADRVLVIDEGRLVEEGSPADLIEKGELFAELHRAQSLTLARGDAE